MDGWVAGWLAGGVGWGGLGLGAAGSGLGWRWGGGVICRHMYINTTRQGQTDRQTDRQTARHITHTHSTHVHR